MNNTPIIYPTSFNENKKVKRTFPHPETLYQDKNKNVRGLFTLLRPYMPYFENYDKSMENILHTYNQQLPPLGNFQLFYALKQNHNSLGDYIIDNDGLFYGGNRNLQIL
jgi:hypothetical protein